MARREHARILTKIWHEDDDWRALDWECQHMYFLLLSQRALTWAGTLPLTIPRWSRLTTGRTVDDVEKVIRQLEERRFVVVDWETDELLIRSFIRNDGVHRQPNTLKGAVRIAAEEVESARIKAEVAAELTRLGFTEYAARVDPSGNPPGGGGEALPGHSPNPPIVTPNGKGSAIPSGTGSGKGSAIPSGTTPNGKGSAKGCAKGAGEGGRGSSSSYVGENSSFDQNPDAKTSKAELALVPNPPTAQQAVAAWHDAFVQHHDAKPTRRQIGQAGREAKALLDAGNPPARVLHAATSAGARGFATLEREYRDLSSRGTPPPARPRPSTTDQRVAQGLALAAKYEALEAMEENQ